MQRNKLFMKLGPSLGPRCDHLSLTVVFTELGCHARCLRCGTIGPERPSYQAARQALPVLGARAGSRYGW
jgi:hypothetical protein